ncbi:MAG: hypothetical protein ABIH00_04565 [Armatimonadota bacterium]
MALKFLEKAYSIDPDYPFTVFNLAAAYDMLGDNKSALKYYVILCDKAEPGSYLINIARERIAELNKK